MICRNQERNLVSLLENGIAALRFHSLKGLCESDAKGFETWNLVGAPWHADLWGNNI
jgi:hypothetical protein